MWRVTPVHHYAYVVFDRDKIPSFFTNRDDSSQKGCWASFLKLYVFRRVLRAANVCSALTQSCSLRIVSFSGDLSSLTAPPFILSPTSLTEFPGELPHI